MAGKPKIPFKDNVNRRVNAIIKGMRGLAALGPRCEDPAHAEKVRASLAAELDLVVSNWKGKSGNKVNAFSL